MTRHWQCPSCKTIHEKTDALEAAETMVKRGIPFQATSPVSCPECKAAIDFDDLLAGGYDHLLLDRPPREELERETRELIQHLLLKAMAERAHSASSADEQTDVRHAAMKYAVDTTGEVLFEKYGLDQAEILSLVEHAIRKGLLRS